MALSKAFTSLLLLLPLLLLPLASAATFTVTNKCTYTVWAAAVPGGGHRLDPNQTWILDVASGTTVGRIWGRTGCSFDSSGHGNCQTGDCGGLLACTAPGSPPETLAEFSLNQNGGQDFYDISFVDGFNVPMDFSPTSGNCHDIRCTADINRQCPAVLKAPGGCNNPCTVFQTNQYCCTSGGCGPTGFSKFFKKHCPDAYSYPEDDAASTFTCPSGVDYRVVFCPVADPEFVACGVANN